jgi:hypothetical protein
MSETPIPRIRVATLLPVLVGLVALIILVMVLTRGSSGDTAKSNEDPAVVGPGGTTVTEPPTPASNPVDAPATTPGMPVAVEVSDTEQISSGTTVSIRAEPEGQSETYGVDARLCRGDVAILDDGTFSPTMGGVCTPVPLAPDTDALIRKVGTPPYQGIDLEFRVGAGSHTFLTQYNGEATVTCGAAHPCQIVLKLQYPNGFGFRGIPVTFS